MKTMLAAGALALSLCAGGAGAATLTATYVDGSNSEFNTEQTPGAVAFEIGFDDALGSTIGVLEGGEVTSFSWINNPFGAGLRELLFGAPDIPGVVKAFGQGGGLTWVFGQQLGGPTFSAISPGEFTYSVSGPTPVPLPPAAALMLAGLASLVAVRRRRRS